MYLRDLLLKKCLFVSSESTMTFVEQQFNICQINYLLGITNGQVKGYMARHEMKELTDQLIDKDKPLSDHLRSLGGHYHFDTHLRDLLPFPETPCLVYGEKDGEYAILDLDVVFDSLIETFKEKGCLSKELDLILNCFSDEIYVTDGKGVTLRANKAFEENSGIPVEKVLGRNVKDLEKEGVFRPSIVRMVLEENSQVTDLQRYNENEKCVLVTGTPAYNETDGSIFRVICNTRDTAKLNSLKAQIEEMVQLKESYYKELLNVGPHDVEHIVANSASMKQLLRTAKKVAEVNTSVLLLGESGVGKSLIAKYIHDQSSRNKQPLITISCGAIPENLLESELFGYEPGAFTGANPKGKIGKIELASNGTLFLDEVGDLPLSLQAKLLQVIQEGVITRLGGNREIKPDVRIIAATNKNLYELVKKEFFREDLYYRLNVVPIELLPLRRRVDDIEALSGRFLERFNKKYNKEKTISQDVLQYFKNYSWPGNVRELENIIERLIIVFNENTIEIEHLPESIKIENLSHATSKNQGWPVLVRSLDRIKGDVEKQVLEKLYGQYKNSYKVAEILKINQSTVVRKLNKYQITKS